MRIGDCSPVPWACCIASRGRCHITWRCEQALRTPPAAGCVSGSTPICYWRQARPRAKMVAVALHKRLCIMPMWQLPASVMRPRTSSP